MLDLYLDDLRPAPKGTVLCRWPQEVIDLIKQGNVRSIDLDHDLGEGSEYANPRTGMDVITWLEEWVQAGNTPPKIWIHTANPVARARMSIAALMIMGRKPEPPKMEVIREGSDPREGQ